jgi:hypothetical protein
MQGAKDPKSKCPAPCRKRFIVSLVMHFCAEHLHAAVVATKVPPATAKLAPVLAALLAVIQEGDAFHIQALIQILPWSEGTPETITLLKDVRVHLLQPHLSSLVSLLYSCWMDSRTQTHRRIAAIFELLSNFDPNDLVPHVATAVNRVCTAGMGRLTLCTDAFVRCFDREPIAELVVEKLLSMRSDRVPSASTLLQHMKPTTLRPHLPLLLQDVDGYLENHLLASTSLELLLRLFDDNHNNHDECGNLNIVVLFRTMVAHLRRLPAYRYASFSQWQRTSAGTALRKDIGRVLSRLSGPSLVAQADAVYALLVDPEFESDVYALGVWNKAQSTAFTLGGLRVLHRLLVPASRAVAPTHRTRLLTVLAHMPLKVLLHEGQRKCRLIVEGQLNLLKESDQPHLSVLDGLSLLSFEVLEASLAELVEALYCPDLYICHRVYNMLLQFPSQKLLLYRRIITENLRKRQQGSDIAELLATLGL